MRQITSLYKTPCFLLIWIAVQAGFCHRVCAAGDPFKPYLNSIPEIKKVISDSTAVNGPVAVTIKKIVLYSRNKTNEIYAIIAYPKLEGKYPALLMLHGGGGNAASMSGLAYEYAAQGYVTMCFDMPGICNNTSTPNSSGAWKTKPGPLERPRFDIAGGLENCTLFDAGLAGIEAFNYLAAQKNVDQANMGITGYSWGGYATTLLSGILGKKVKAAYAVYGCGFYDKGSYWTKMISELPDAVRSAWLEYFDAGRRAKFITAPYFIDSPTNDTYFWPEAVTNTLGAVPGLKNHVWNANLNHKQSSSGKLMMKLYFAYFLKGNGLPFGSVKITEQHLKPDGSLEVVIQTVLPQQTAVDSVLLYYSKKTDRWQSRLWLPLVARPDRDGRYAVSIPPELVKDDVDYYAYMTDKRSVAVSGDMHSAASGN